jgi:phosphohistidine phosphatase
VKRLLLLRHAKSDWSDDDLDDHARPLNARGRAAATRMGQYLRDNGLRPDLVICSTATRTRETLDRILEVLPVDAEIIHDRGMYLAMPDRMLELALDHAAAVDFDPSVILVIAHNPGTHSLALELAAEGDPETLRTLNMKYPTGSLTVIESDSDSWPDIMKGGRLAGFIMPRALPPVGG